MVTGDVPADIAIHRHAHLNEGLVTEDPVPEAAPLLGSPEQVGADLEKAAKMGIGHRTAAGPAATLTTPPCATCSTRMLGRLHHCLEARTNYDQQRAFHSHPHPGGAADVTPVARVLRMGSSARSAHV